MSNPETIEIHGLNTIHKLCKFAADNGMAGSSFTAIVDRVFEEMGDLNKLKNPWVYVDTEGYPELSQKNDGENPSSREVFFELRHNQGTHHGWYIAIDGDQSDDEYGDEGAENFEYKFNSNIGDELFDEDSVYRWMYVPNPEGQENK